MKRFVILACLALAPLLRAVEIASHGRASLSIVISANATPATRKAAATLVDYLGRISGGTFAIATGDGKSGIAVGQPADFPALELIVPWKPGEPTEREDYLFRSTTDGLLLIGATDLAIEHAVWDLLYRLGYRQFFPGPHWEVIPHTPDLRLDIDVREHPAYFARRIWYGFGMWGYNDAPYADWCAKNRATSGIQLSTGHSYQAIIARNKAEFAAHPEYLGLVKGERKSTKFCISNPGLRALVVADALRQFEKKPDLDSISIDPSDGGGWCECAECAKLGNVSDRALLLANEVAVAVAKKYPGKRVGMYAYNEHAAPPKIPVNPNVVISVATAFIKGGWTLDEVMSGWAAQGATLGTREYYSVNAWDHDQPAAARGGNIPYLARTIPEFHAKGSRYMSAESGDNWGPDGLGYYLASRMLWKPREAERVDALIEDFLTRAFGPAKEPMREFYRQLDGSRLHLVRDDQLGRMFLSLAEARRLAETPEIRARLDDLVLYARYADLYAAYTQARSGTRQAAFEALIRHAYRMRTTMLVHAKALYRDLVGRDKTIGIPDNAKWDIPEGSNPWKSNEPFKPDEIEKFIATGIARRPLASFDFTPVPYGGELVSAAGLQLPEVPRGYFGPGRGQQIFYTRVDQAPATIRLSITGGLIAHYRDRGNVRIELWKVSDSGESAARRTLMAEDSSVPPDGKEHAVALAVREVGVYQLVVNDGGDRTALTWQCALPFAIKSSEEEPMSASYIGPWLLYFYVPKGTRTIGLFGGEHGEVHNSAGRAIFWLNGRERNYYAIEVPDGEDGTLWSIHYGRGSVRLLTVPPYFARRPAELLLPAGVVFAHRGAARQ